MANTTADCIIRCTSFTDFQASVLEYANVGTSLLSFLGSIFIIIIYIRIKELRSFAFRLVFMTSVADFFYSFGGMLGDAGGNENTILGANPGLCLFQAWIISFFQLSSLVWSTSISFTLHMAFLNQKIQFYPSEVYKLEKWYHCLAWVYPFVMSILPFITNSYGDEGGYCWIQNHSQHIAWRFFQFYIPLSLAFFYNAYVYYQIWKKLKIDDNNDPLRAKMVARLKLYPLVLVICHFLGLLNTIEEVFNKGKETFVLSLAFLITSSLQGFLNAIVYGLTPDVQAKVCSFSQMTVSEIKSQPANNGYRELQSVKHHSKANGTLI